MISTARWTALAAFAAAISIGGCGGGGQGKVGAPIEPVTLRMADPNNGTATDSVHDYIQQVSKLSHGAIRIKLVSAPGESVDYEKRIVAQTAAGKYDLAWVGGRVLDALGVADAAALQVPFLIDNYATERKVIGGSIGMHLTSELSKAHVIGLGMLDDRMRYIVTAKPIATPTDLLGQRMRIYDSPSQAQAWRDFGALPVPYGGNTARAAGDMVSHRLFGLESDTGTWKSQAFTGSVMSVGPAIWPRTVALMAAPAAFRRLPPAAQNVLRSAVPAANAKFLTEAVATDAANITQICRVGGSVATLSGAKLRGFLHAGDAIATQLDTHSVTLAQLIDQIRSLKGSTPSQSVPAVPASCAPSRAALATTAVSDSSPASLALRQAVRPGTVYRSRADYNTMKRIIGQVEAENNSGTFTFHFLSGGHFIFDQDPAFPDIVPEQSRHPKGTYRVKGDLIITASPDPLTGTVYRETSRCRAGHETISCVIITDTGGFSAPLGFQGMTEPLRLVGG